ncbi:MAG: hypothetical protein QGH94_12105 [Phycisphaerae bacterium]|jgi:hypothetical protein|nr:hypothetical protein [Phycisphaerae bacterium]MDP7288725.1 hypothetical protein [Phycisphaerae bacterium]
MTNEQTNELSGSRLPAPHRCGTPCLLLLIVFISGLLAGGGLTVIFDLDEEIAKVLGVKKKSRSIIELRDRLTDRYADELGLTGENKEKMRELFNEQLKGSVQRRVNILNKVTEGLSPLLSEAQKAKWEQIKAERIKKWSEG